MNPRSHYPYLTLHHHDDPDAGPQTGPETPEYLVPILAVYDNPDEAARRERATILYCQGHRTADIAAHLSVPVSTIKSWLTDARYLLAAELRVSREELQLRAIESARALAAEAWTAYERDRDLQRAILAGEHDYQRRRITRPDCSSTQQRMSVIFPPPAGSRLRPERSLLSSEGRTGDGGEDPTGNLLYEEVERPRYTSQAARLLTVALAAQREVARLQGLYEHVPPPPQPVDFHLHGPEPEPAPAPTTAAAAPASPPDSPDSRESAGSAPLSPPDSPPEASDLRGEASIASTDNGTSIAPTAPFPVESAMRDCRGALRAPSDDAGTDQADREAMMGKG